MQDPTNIIVGLIVFILCAMFACLLTAMDKYIEIKPWHFFVGGTVSFIAAAIWG